MGKNKATRLFSTRVKSIKIDVLTCYLQCFVGILSQGGEVQKNARLCFSSTAVSRSSRSCYVGRRTGICIPTDGGNDFIISVFAGMRHVFFQPHPRPIKDLCASQFGFAFDFAPLPQVRASNTTTRYHHRNIYDHIRNVKNVHRCRVLRVRDTKKKQGALTSLTWRFPKVRIPHGVPERLRFPCKRTTVIVNDFGVPPISGLTPWAAT